MWHDKYKQSMHQTHEYSQHIWIIWVVWFSDLVYVYELSCCGFDSRCGLIQQIKFWFYEQMQLIQRMKYFYQWNKSSYFYSIKEIFLCNEWTIFIQRIYLLHATNSLFLHLFIQETKHLLMNFELFLFNKVNIKYMLTET